MCIRIVPIKFYDNELIEAVSDIVRERFESSVYVQEEAIELNGGHDSVRNQTNSNWILEQLLVRLPVNGTRYLALTEKDLYCPVLTYVFGEATLGGQAAVVSSHRFHSELYGLTPNPASVKSRLQNEVVHELGHTFGLIHCPYQGCVMYPSSYVEDIDMKPNSFCEKCHQILLSSRGD